MPNPAEPEAAAVELEAGGALLVALDVVGTDRLDCPPLADLFGFGVAFLGFDFSFGLAFLGFGGGGLLGAGGFGGRGRVGGHQPPNACSWNKIRLASIISNSIDIRFITGRA
jgi:hypothetical protein